MRGSGESPDQLLETTESNGDAAPRRSNGTRPPGGKALLRKLQLLGSSGYEEVAAEALSMALDEGQLEDLRARTTQVVPLPGQAKGNGRRAKKAAAAAKAVPAEQVATAMQEAAVMLGQPDPSLPQWRQLGPTTVPNGQTYGSSRVNVSGRIASIAIDPSNASHVLVGAANGGVWESFDKGSSWFPRTDYQATLAVGAIAFDPTDPSVVYCGLGEGNWWSWLGTGVLRSTDGGTTWSPRCTAPFVGQGFYDLVVDSHDHRRLLAATTGGLYVSTDRGLTWTQRRAGGDVVGLDRVRHGGQHPGCLQRWALALEQPRRQLHGGVAPGCAVRVLPAGRRDLTLGPDDRLRVGHGCAEHGGRPDGVPLASCQQHLDGPDAAARSRHRPVLVRLVPRGLAGQRRPDLLRRDQRPPRHAVRVDVDLGRHRHQVER